MLVLGGKMFAGDQLVITVGVTATGEKRILGLVQTATGNKRAIASFLRELRDRGFPTDQPLLVVPDGSKGLRAAVRDVFGDAGQVAVQRCQWHRRENVVRSGAPAQVFTKTRRYVPVQESHHGWRSGYFACTQPLEDYRIAGGTVKSIAGTSP